MSKRRKPQDRQIRIRSIRRENVDIGKLGHAIIALAQAQAEKEAQAHHEAADAKRKKATPNIEESA